MGELAQQGRDKLTYVVSEPISSFGLWVEQLIAESTGKQGKGILPVADEPLGPPEVYGDDRVFVYLRNEDEPDAELDAADRGARPGGPPDHHRSVIGGAADLGRIFFFAEFATAVAGWALGINPFDQPNVQEAKDNTAAHPRRRALARRRAGLARGAARRRGAAATTWRSSGYVPPSDGVRRGGDRTAHSHPGAHQVHDDVRLRAALPALDRPVPQGRPAERPVPPARPRRRARTSRSRGGLLVRAPEERSGPGDLQTLREHGLPAERGVEVDGPRLP